MASVSSGLSFIDRYMGGFQPGDNVVWMAEEGTFINDFVSAFAGSAAKGAGRTLIYVNSNCAPQKILRRHTRRGPGCRFLHVDAFTHGKGRGDGIFLDFYEDPPADGGFESVCIERPSDAEKFSRILSEIEDECGEGVRYVFDSLTGLSELWGGERAVQEFFAHHCPKLYELQTVAYWVLEIEAHPRPFLANLSHITQVVIQLRNSEEGFCEMKFSKAEDRPSRVLNEALRYKVAEESIEFVERTPDRGLGVGTRIRELRAGQNLTQAELARMLDITPSALCQIENNQVHPSLPLVLDLSRVLGCPLDRFFPGQAGERVGKGGWIVHKRKDQMHPRGTKKGKRSALEIHPLLPETGEGKGVHPYLLRLEAGAEGNRAFFDHKGPEFGWVVSGLLNVEVQHEKVVLRKGDSIYLEGEILKRWRVEGGNRCELLWVLA